MIEFSLKGGHQMMGAGACDTGEENQEEWFLSPV